MNISDIKQKEMERTSQELAIWQNTQWRWRCSKIVQKSLSSLQCEPKQWLTLTNVLYLSANSKLTKFLQPRSASLHKKGVREFWNSKNPPIFPISPDFSNILNERRHFGIPAVVYLNINVQIVLTSSDGKRLTSKRSLRFPWYVHLKLPIPTNVKP